MRLTVLLPFVLVLSGTLLAIIFYRTPHPRAADHVHIALVGASIGQAWQLAGWPARAHAPRFTAESLAVWQFDKAPAIEEMLLRPGVRFRLSRQYLKSLLRRPVKPDIVILKECSSYFPGDLETYRNSIRTWVSRLKGRDIEVVLSTVVPVTRERAARDPGKQESLTEYNRWIRQYAAAEGLRLLDLESALRSSGNDTFLRNEFAAPDGSHLSGAAYAVLDRALLDLVGRTALAAGAR